MASREPAIKAGGPNKSAARRPATLGTAANASKARLKTRSSLSSITNRQLDNSEEWKGGFRADQNGETKRSSIAASTRSTSPTKASVGRRSGLGSTSSAEKQATTERSSPASALKSSNKTVNPNARPTNTSRPIRSTRPINYTPSSTTKPNDSNKMTKKLPAVYTTPSSALANTPSAGSTDKATTSPEKRPTLPARKSTMRVTVEQKLREMALVNELIQAAMAKDNEETAEVKEEYGKQGDEQLAMLRAKLEEAKRNEGEELSRNTEDQLVKLRDESTKPVDNVADLQAKLAFNQQETAMLRNELSSLRQRLAIFDKPEEQANYHGTEEAHADAHSDTSDTTDYEALLAPHPIELEVWRQKYERSEERLGEHMREAERELEEAKKAFYAQGLEEGKAQSNAEHQKHEAETRDRCKHYDANLQIQMQMRKQIYTKYVRLQEVHEDLKQKTDGEREASKLAIKQLELSVQDLKNQKDDNAATMEQKLQYLLNATHNSQVFKDQQTAAQAQKQTEVFKSALESRKQRIAELEAAASDQISKFHAQMDASVNQIQRLEGLVARHNTNYDEAAHRKDSEIAHLRTVVEALQDQVRDVSERKDREMDNQRFQLIQAHDDSVSKLRSDYEQKIIAMRANSEMLMGKLKDSETKALDEAQSTIDQLHQELEAAKANQELLQSTADDTSALLKISDEEKTELQNHMDALSDEIDKQDAKHQAAIETLRQNLEIEYSVEIQRLQSLHDEALDKSHVGLAKLVQELQDAQNEKVSLRNQRAEFQQELAKAGEVAEQRAQRLREAEAALKETEAELVKLQTKKPDGSPDAGRTLLTEGPQQGGGWAVPAKYAEGLGNATSSILGNMAGISERLRQLQSANEERLVSEERICKNAGLPSPARHQISTIAEDGEESESEEEIQEYSW